MPRFPAPQAQAQAQAQAEVQEHLSTFPPVLKQVEQEMLYRFATDVASLPSFIVLSYVNSSVPNHATIYLIGSASLGRVQRDRPNGSGMDATYWGRDCYIQANTNVEPSSDFSYTIGPRP